MNEEEENFSGGKDRIPSGLTGDGEFFGSHGQQELQRRSDFLWRIVKDDPRFQSHGRAIALADPTAENVADQVAVAKLIGVCACEAVPEEDVPWRRRALEAAGLTTDFYVEWRGEASALDAARNVLEERPLPMDLTLRAVDANTSPETMQGLDAVTQACEVLLPNGAFMRGVHRPSVCLYAEDPSVSVVGTSAAVAAFHPAHARAGCAWWGMLATTPDRRGAGIALHLGARALIEMNERHGIGEVFTGVRPGNRPSEALCSKLGLRPTEFQILLAIAPEVLGAGQVTK